MKKLYAVLFLLVATTLVGCGIKTPITADTEVTGDVQDIEMTGENMEMTGDDVLLEVTGEDIEDFDATEVTKVEGSDEVENDESVNQVGKEVDELIEERNAQPKDDTKLNEEDIDLMEEIIQKIQEIGS